MSHNISPIEPDTTVIGEVTWSTFKPWEEAKTLEIEGERVRYKGVGGVRILMRGKRKRKIEFNKDKNRARDYWSIYIP